MKVKIITADSLGELEVSINKFMDRLDDYLVKDVKIFCSPSIVGSYFGAMLILVRNSED